METGNTSQIPQLATLTLSKPVIQSWQVGQLLNATVVTAASSPEQIILRIGNTTIQASGSQINPAPGQNLKLEVIHTEPQPVLKVVSPPATAQPLTEALKILLPRQTPLPPLLANLVFLTGDAGRSLPVLPHKVDQIIKKLIVELPTDKKLSSADGLKRALFLSGMFLENKLAGSGTRDIGGSIDQDFKGSLLRLLQNLQQATSSTGSRNTAGQLGGTEPKQVSPASTGPLPNVQNAQIKQSPNPLLNIPADTDDALTKGENMRIQGRQTPLLTNAPLQAQSRSTASVQNFQSSSQIINELLQQVNGAIARLQVNQISSLSHPDNIQPVLSFELPLRHEDRIDVIQIRIFQDRAANTPEQPGRWSASLVMELEALGTVYANVTISQQQVWTSLWAERKSTVEIINQHIQNLYQGYDKAGLSIGATHCSHGTPPLTMNNAHKVLIDTNA